MKSKEKINYIFICPYLTSKMGHDYNYMNALHDVFLQKKIDFKIFIPQSKLLINKINFKKNLPLLKKNFLGKIIYIIEFFISINRYINIHSNKTQNIIFIESFHFIHFILILIKILFKFKIKIAILLRYKHIFNIKNKYINFLIIRCLKFLLKNRLILFTDSISIRDYIKKFTNSKVFVLPIPHIINSSKKANSFNKKNYRLWIPGPIRDEKGINMLIRSLEITDVLPMTILICESVKSRLTKFKNINIEFVKKELSSKAYYDHLTSVDFILLPYNPIFYEFSTSGIFVESISLGVPALVSKNTWMDNEYKKNDIVELSFEWNSFLLNNVLSKIMNYKQVQLDFIKMKKKYCLYHNPHNFYEILTDIVHNSYA